MAIKRTLSADRRDEVIRQACMRTIPVEVRGGGSAVRQAGRSRFLRAVLDGRGLHVMIDLPTVSGKPVPVRKGERLDLVFQHNGQRLGFAGDVEGRCFHKLSEGISVPALVVSYPEELEIRQRRNYYRVTMSSGQPTTVTFREVVQGRGRGRGGQDQALYSGVIRDISAGGMALLCQQHLPVSFDVGSKVKLFFQLGGVEGNLKLEGEVRNSRRARSGPGTIYGIAFVNTEKDLRTRKAIDDIQRFVVARQREILKRVKAT